MPQVLPSPCVGWVGPWHCQPRGPLVTPFTAAYFSLLIPRVWPTFSFVPQPLI